jgi:hypothetical protein
MSGRFILTFLMIIYLEKIVYGYLIYYQMFIFFVDVFCFLIFCMDR